MLAARRAEAVALDEIALQQHVRGGGRMSAAAVMARVDEIQSRIDMLRGTAPAPQAAPTQSFQAALHAGHRRPDRHRGRRARPAPAPPTPFAAEIEAAAQRHGHRPRAAQGASSARSRTSTRPPAAPRAPAA